MPVVKDAEELVLAQDENAAIFIGPKGTPIPANEIVALDAAYSEVGYVTLAGFKLAASFTHKDIEAMQSKFPIRRLNQASALDATFEMQQWNGATLPLAFGGGAVEEPTAGHYRFDIPDGGTDERVLIFQWADGDFNYRVVIPNGSVTGSVDTTFSRDDEAKLPITFSALKAVGLPIGRLLSDNPAWVEAS